MKYSFKNTSDYLTQHHTIISLPPRTDLTVQESWRDTIPLASSASHKHLQWSHTHNLSNESGQWMIINPEFTVQIRVSLSTNILNKQNYPTPQMTILIGCGCSITEDSITCSNLNHHNQTSHDFWFVNVCMWAVEQSCQHWSCLLRIT